MEQFQCYFDSVKEQACHVAVMLVERFLPLEPQAMKDGTDILQVLRANLHMGWSPQMSKPLKEMAEVEIEVAQYLFDDASVFTKQVITTYMDEFSTRQLLTAFVKKLNKSLPFLLMNDYRLAVNTNSLQRQLVVKSLLQGKAIEN